MNSIKNCLQFFPIPLFGSVMGLTGLTIAYQRASSFFNYPDVLGTALAYLVLILFGILLFIYSMKTLLYFNEVKKEFNHPIRLNFFPAISISLLLLSIAFHPIHHALSFLFWTL
nr:hypothetical protein [Pseudobdellovibrionaceae bacterium]